MNPLHKETDALKMELKASMLRYVNHKTKVFSSLSYEELRQLEDESQAKCIKIDQLNNKKIKERLLQTSYFNSVTVKSQEHTASILKSYLSRHLTYVISQIKEFTEKEIDMDWDQLADQYNTNTKVREENQLDGQLLFEMGLTKEVARQFIIEKSGLLGQSKLMSLIKESSL